MLGAPVAGNVGMVVVTTSNRPPDALYEGGLNRALFLPFLDVLKRHMDIIEMSGEKDYRREEYPGSGECEGQSSSYFWPAHEAETRQALETIFACGGAPAETNLPIPVRMGRRVRVPNANETCAWFEFDDLCQQPLGAADYLAICERYPTLIVDHVPQLDASRFNEARRFVTLIDALYESKTRLVLASHVPLNELLVHFDVTLETDDGDEEIAGEEIMRKSNSETKHGTMEQQTLVKGEGGSSSSAATTMIRTKEGIVEWSATGRIGVSLAQLSAVRDVSFSFQRAESRLVEMNNGAWGRK